MRKIDNLVPHDPENGKWGDCHRVCMAMIMGLHPEEVPHFYRDGENADRDVQQRRIEDFLKEHGLVQGHMAFNAELDEVLNTTGLLAPGVAFILGGTSRRGCGHSVVCLDGKIWHDPTGSGIVGPMADNHYWLTFLCPLPGSWGSSGD